MRHKVFSSVLLASMAIWSVNAELVQIANKPYDDGLGNASGGVYRIPAMAKSTWITATRRNTLWNRTSCTRPQLHCARM